MAAIQIVRSIANSNAINDVLRSAETADGSRDVRSFVGIDSEDHSITQAVLEASSGSEQQPAAIEGIVISYYVKLDRSPFEIDGMSHAPVMEYVRSWFPVSQLTPDFQQKIEADFARFDSILQPASVGTLGRVRGWTVEDEDHEGVPGEKARSWFVMTGWESMEHFKRSTSTDEFKEAIPILIGWGAQYKMWFTEQQSAAN